MEKKTKIGELQTKIKKKNNQHMGIYIKKQNNIKYLVLR